MLHPFSLFSLVRFINDEYFYLNKHIIINKIYQHGISVHDIFHWFKLCDIFNILLRACFFLVIYNRQLQSI